ncbi:MAG: carboxypeptidase-like regulatory domain-containing protein [Candidatus Acidoferrales bacterium]
MYAAVAALVGSFLVPPLLGQQAAETALLESAIEGLVVKAGTGEPLKKAWLSLERVQSERRVYSTITDSSGRFILKSIEPGRYRLWAERNGYVRQEFGQRGPNQPGSILSLAPGQTLQDIVFRLIPAAVISGRVYDEEGEPIAGATIQAMRKRYRSGRRKLAPAGTDRTDDLGEYRIYGLRPGPYYVSATFVPGWIRARTFTRKAGGEREPSYPPTYYPGTNDLAQAVPVGVRAGEEVRAIDFTLVPSGAVRIRGRVFNAVIGRPGRGALVMLYPRESGVSRFAVRSRVYVDDPQGNFEISGVIPGSYNLQAFWSDSENQYVGRLPLEVGTLDIEGINIVISPGVRLSGRVRVEGNPQSKLSDLSVGLESLEKGFILNRAEVRTDGSFVLPNVSVGDYRVKLENMPEDWYLKSARLDGQDVLERGIEITTGQAGSLELVLSSAAGRIDGPVLDADREPIPAAYVVLVPDRRRRDRTELYKITTTDQYGQFTLRGIAPGEYTLFAWEEIEVGAYYDPDLLRRYEKSGQSVRVREADHLSLQLELIPADEVLR